MKRSVLLITALLMGTTVLRAELAQGEAGRIADAIYRAEGGARAKVPYGILSVRVNGEAEARRVCITTIRNNHLRWEQSGKPGEFVDYLGNVYCPASADPSGNRNWRRNVKALLQRP